MVLGILTFIVLFMALGQAILVPVATRNKFSRREWRFAQAGLVFRMAMTYGYYRFTLSTAADAVGYFSHAFYGMHFSFAEFFTPGTSFVTQFTILLMPFARFLADEYDPCYLLTYVPYGLLGFAGAVLLYLTLRHIAPQQRRMCLLLAFFLPNIAFWTSNLGKDSVAFFGIAFIMYGLLVALSMRRRITALFIGGVATYLVRPHMVLFLVAAVLLGVFVQRQAFSARKVAILVIAVGALVFLGGDIMRYVGVAPQSPSSGEEDGVGSRVGSYYDAGMKRIDEGAQNLNTGGSAAGRKSAKLLYAPVYLVQFLAGPFVWQAHTPLQLFSAVESIIYQVMLVYLLMNWRLFRKARLLDLKYVWVFYILIASTIMGMTYTNLGLAVRQKCMVLPAVLILFAALRAEKLRLKASKSAARLPSAPIAQPPIPSPSLAGRLL